MGHTEDPAAEDDRGDDLIMIVICDTCGADFEWNVGVDVEDSACPACRLA